MTELDEKRDHLSEVGVAVLNMNNARQLQWAFIHAPGAEGCTVHS